MRILVGLEHFGLIGGSERYAAAVARELGRRGHEISIVAGARSGAALSDVECEIVPSYSDLESSQGELRELHDAVARRAPDVVLVLSIRSADAFDTLLDCGPPVVRFVQDHTLFCPGLDKVYEDGGLCDQPHGLRCLQRYWLASGCIGFKPAHHGSPALDGVTGLWKHLRDFERARRAERFVVASQYMRRELERAGLEPSRIAVLPYFTLSNSTAIERREPPAATRAFLESSRDAIVFTPARLTVPDKGVDYLLSALAKTRRPSRAVIAGAGPAEEWLRAKAIDEGLGERVHFSGWLEPGAIETLYAASELVVCPSMWNEPFGLVGLEAMAHGRAVVAFDVGAIGEWLEHGRTGRIVRRGDTGELARAIDELLGDAGRRAQMGRAGRERLEREFGAERHVAALESLLHEVAGAR